MRAYEVTVIVLSSLNDEERESILNRVVELLTHGEGEDNKPVAHHWGLRGLAYPINDLKDGYYVLYDAQLDPEKISSLERDIMYEPNIMRHLVVRKEA